MESPDISDEQIEKGLVYLPTNTGDESRARIAEIHYRGILVGTRHEYPKRNVIALTIYQSVMFFSNEKKDRAIVIAAAMGGFIHGHFDLIPNSEEIVWALEFPRPHPLVRMFLWQQKVSQQMQQKEEDGFTIERKRFEP